MKPLEDWEVVERSLFIHQVDDATQSLQANRVAWCGFVGQPEQVRYRPVEVTCVKCLEEEIAQGRNHHLKDKCEQRLEELGWKTGK